jgi:hypothetical protein
MYVSFVAGPTMMFHFSRDEFIGIQNKLFAKYSLIFAATGWIAFAGHYFNRGSSLDWTSAHTLAMLANGIAGELNYWGFIPASSKALEEEKNAKNDDELQSAKTKFKIMHGLAMVANFISVGINIGVSCTY